MIHNFPKFFNEIVSSDPEVADMPFISSLSPINKKNSPFKTLEFINANQLSENQKADYSKQWASLIYSDKENQRRLGVGLVLYSTFKGGFGFGPSSFISMAPVAVQLATPQYVEVSESVYNNDNPSVEHFTEQFFRNNLDNRKLVEYVSKDYNLNADDEIVISDTTLKEKMPVLIKETIDDYVVAKTYIAIPAKTGYQFYKKTNEADGNRTYYKITPLGIKNTLIEYEYGVPGDVVNSIVENNINEQETVREVQNDENQDLVDPVNEETQLYKQSTTNNLYEENMGDVALGFILGDKKQTPKAKGKMTYSYGNNKRGDLLANTTFDAIKSGERTATTRYVSQGNIEYWGKLNVGDIVEFESASGEKLYVQVTKELTKLESNVNPEEWSKKEGWSVSYFNKNVRPKISEAYQFEYRYISNNETAYQLNLFDNTPERDKTIYDFQPDEEWRDVTGNKIC